MCSWIKAYTRTQRLFFFYFLFGQYKYKSSQHKQYISKKKFFLNDIILFNTKICTVHIACVIPMFLFMIYRSLFPFWKQTHRRKQNKMILAGSLASTRYDPQNPEGRLLNSSSCDQNPGKMAVSRVEATAQAVLS